MESDSDVELDPNVIARNVIALVCYNIKFDFLENAQKKF